MTTDRYLVVSCDGHAHPSLIDDMPRYCPDRYRDELDEQIAIFESKEWTPSDFTFVPADRFPKDVQDLFVERSQSPGYRDPEIRLRHMDEQGIAAEVMFFGGGGFGPIPFSTHESEELRAAGIRMFNHWLADFVGAAPERMIGVAQIPAWDVDAAVEEIRWAREHGLGAVNLPAPRRTLTPYDDPSWEPLWNVCEELDLSLNCHSGNVDIPDSNSPGAAALLLANMHILGRAGLPFLIFGGVFERHPGLRMVFTEQRGAWVPETLRNLDAIYESPLSGASDFLPRRPSEYWASNCYLGNSFMARFEVDMRDEVGVDTMMWGADYPHVEGTWPWTVESLRASFAGVPHDDVARILGLNAVECYGLDAQHLGRIAADIGPSVAEVDTPLDEIPEDAQRMPTLGFRTIGEYA